MSIAQRIEEQGVPSFGTIKEVLQAQMDKQKQSGTQRLYPRDGGPELTQLEEDIADMLGIAKGHLLLYANGMTAVRDALDISDPTAGTRILRGEQHYSQAGKVISKYLGRDEEREKQGRLGKGRGGCVFAVNQGSIEDIERKLTDKRPEIVFFETVTNGSEMATLDVKNFLGLPILRDLDPVIILDNTLPTSTGVPLGRMIETSDRKIIGVESGTKYLGVNYEMCGVAYTYNQDILTILKERRQAYGSLLSTSAIRAIRQQMPKTAEEYQSRTKAFFKHTLKLARACASSDGNNNEFVVVHPNLSSHPNSEYANICAPDGISPVFFIVPTDFSGVGHISIAARLGHDSVIRQFSDEGCKPYGQSFGFERIRIWPDDSAPVVRVSGGIYSEVDQAALDKAFYEVLSNYQ